MMAHQDPAGQFDALLQGLPSVQPVAKQKFVPPPPAATAHWCLHVAVSTAGQFGYARKQRPSSQTPLPPQDVVSGSCTQVEPLQLKHALQPGAQTPPSQMSHPVHGAQVSPSMPQIAKVSPARHVPPSQQPAQSAVQSTGCPQVFWTMPHLLAQVVVSGSGVQPHIPGVPPPPHVFGAVQPQVIGPSQPSLNVPH